jgi:putative endonuclease
MPHARQSLGAFGEQSARVYFEQQGYVVLAQNWHAGRYGELDIVATRDNEVVFVEVKTRSGMGFGKPEEAVNSTKLAKLQGAAQAFLLAHPLVVGEPRFDVVAVVVGPGGRVEEFKHFAGIS